MHIVTFLVVGVLSGASRLAGASVFAHSDVALDVQPPTPGSAHGDVAPLLKTGLEAFRAGEPSDVATDHARLAASPALFRREQAKPPAEPAAAAAAAAEFPTEAAVQRATVAAPPAPERTAADASGWIGIVRVAWLTTSSLAFLAPAFYSQFTGLHWFAMLFSAQSVASWAFQFCEAGGAQVLLADPSGCPDGVYNSLRLICNGLGYFICLQMALALLGPEDPGLQHVEDNAEAHLGDQARRRFLSQPMQDSPGCFGYSWLMGANGSRVPQDVIMFSRVIPALSLLIFIYGYSDWQHFHWECMKWFATALLLSLWTFWMKRREFVASVLLRLGFWRRTLHCVLLPLAMLGTTSSVIQQTGNIVWLRGMWYVVVSALAVFEIWRVQLGDSVTFTYDDPVRNPIVAHYILLAMPALGVGTVVLTAAVDVTEHLGPGGALDWPSLSRAITREPGEYVFMLGTMLTATAAAATWRLVDMMSAYHEEMYQRGNGDQHRESERSVDKWVTQGGGSWKDANKSAAAAAATNASNVPLPFRQAGQILGSIAVLMAFVGATMHGELRTSLLVGFLTLEAIAIVLNTMSAFKYGVPNHARVLVAGLLLVNTMGFLGTFQDNIMIPDWMAVYREAIYNCHGTAMIILYLLWPLTWVSEAEIVMPVLVQWHRVCK